MNPRRQTRPSLARFAILLVIGIVGASSDPLAAAPVDPVEDLRAALSELPKKADDYNNPIVLDYRDDTLKKRIDKIRGLKDLQRALVLKEWQDNIVGAKLSDVDEKYRKMVGQLFTDEVRKAIKKDHATTQMAVANLLGEMGATVRALDRRERHGFVRSLTPELIELAGSTKDPDVRQAALRALGKIDPVPSDAAKLLREVIARNQIEEKRLAAEAITSMIETLVRMNRISAEREGIIITQQDVVETCVEMVPVAILGLEPKETDPQVCRLCADSLHQAAAALNFLVPRPFERRELPPQGRKKTPSELEYYKEKVADVKAERALVRPLVAVLKKHGDDLKQVLVHIDDAEARLLTCRTLEQMASARLRLLRRAADVPEAHVDGPGTTKGEDWLAEQLLDGIRPALSVIGPRIQEDDVRVRRAALDMLEMLEEKATPALSSLTAALEDKDLFVRWSAARALGKMEPDKAADAVKALAGALEDRDVDVRRTAAAMLEAYGAAAKSAVDALTKVIARDDVLAKGDVEFRVLAMRALASINGPEAATAVDVLISQLREKDARIRAAAAHTLGTFGRLARSAEQSLRRRLDDDDPAVRRAASDALLNILIEPTRN